MSQHDEDAVYNAIKEAVENAVGIFGIEGVLKLSMFPSATLEQALQEAA